MKQKSSREQIKIKYIAQEKSKNKLLNYKDLDYPQFAEKVTTNLGLQKEKYYRLYYKDQKQDQIVITIAQDYEIFINNVEPLILYLEETKDQNFDFRKSEKKPAQSYEVQKLREELQLRDVQLQKLQRQCDQLKKYQNHKDVIKSHKDKIIQELREFKKNLEEKTAKTLSEKLKQIEKGLENDKKKAGDFEHKVGCKSLKECKYKSKIIGLKFSCLVCEADFCQKCADEQFKYKNSNHEPSHPMIKLRNSSWDDRLMVKNKISQQQPNNMIAGELQEKTKTIIEFRGWSQQKARKFVLDNIKLDLQQLIDKAFTNDS